MGTLKEKGLFAGVTEEQPSSIEMLTKWLVEVWVDKVPTDGMRRTTIQTNKGGAIMCLEEIKNRPLTQEEKDSLREGPYILSDYGITYDGNYIEKRKPHDD